MSHRCSRLKARWSLNRKPRIHFCGCQNPSLSFGFYPVTLLPMRSRFSGLISSHRAVPQMAHSLPSFTLSRRYSTYQIQECSRFSLSLCFLRSDSVLAERHRQRRCLVVFPPPLENRDEFYIYILCKIFGKLSRRFALHFGLQVHVCFLSLWKIEPGKLSVQVLYLCARISLLVFIPKAKNRMNWLNIKTNLVHVHPRKWAPCTVLFA